MALYPALDMGGVVLDDGNAAHGGAAFGGKAAAFDGQVFDQDHVVACVQWDAVAVTVARVADHARISPRADFIIEVEHIGQVARPIVGVEAGEHAVGEDLGGGVFGPHGGGQTAPVVWVWFSGLLGGAGVAEGDVCGVGEFGTW